MRAAAGRARKLGISASSSPALAAVVSVALAVLSAGCGYTLVGRGSLLPDTIKRIAFPPFKNSTPRIGLEQRLSAAVARELAARGRFSVSAKEGDGDAELSGEIIGFALNPVAADSLGRATRYQIEITAKVALTELPSGKPIWKNDAYAFRENYDVAGGGVGASNYSDLENVAIDAEADRFAQSLVTSVLEGF
ncbi:MAG TPA: LptE family protein [Thermoanaerobaculia bacterium]|nr:LptE family protein [Thermoanaerobaculia bacterium]